MSGRCLEGVWMMSGRCLDSNVLEQIMVFAKFIWKVSGRCLEGVWNVYGRCLEGVWHEHSTLTLLAQVFNAYPN